jgi:hypothetical protein
MQFTATHKLQYAPTMVYYTAGKQKNTPQGYAMWMNLKNEYGKEAR